MRASVVVEHLQYGISLSRVDGQLRFLQCAEELGLDLMEQASLRQRVHALQRLRLFERGQTIRGRKEATYGHAEYRCNAETEYGRTLRRWLCKESRVASVTRTRPSNCATTLFLRVPSVPSTDRFRQSFNVSM